MGSIRNRPGFKEERFLLAKQFARLTGGEGIAMRVLGDMTQEYVTSMGQFLMPLKEAYPNKPLDFWNNISQDIGDSILNRGRESLSLFFDMIAPVYYENFTTSELKELIKFYESPLGQKLQNTTKAMVRGIHQNACDWSGIILERSTQMISDKLENLRDELSNNGDA